MGYTHYLRINNYFDDDNFEVWSMICKSMADRIDFEICGKPGEPPVFTTIKVFFNGSEPDNCEDFLIEDDSIGFHFCKTNRYPYDALVCGCLIALKHCFPKQVVVSSDGEQDDWKGGKYLYEHTVKALCTEQGPWSGYNPEEEGNE